MDQWRERKGWRDECPSSYEDDLEWHHSVPKYDSWYEDKGLPDETPLAKKDFWRELNDLQGMDAAAAACVIIPLFVLVAPFLVAFLLWLFGVDMNGTVL